MTMASCFILLTVLAFAQAEDGLYLGTEETLKRTLDALDKGLDFMESEYKHVNLDAAIGTRVTEGKFHFKILAYIHSITIIRVIFKL